MIDIKTYKSNNNVVYSCKYHVVWCPKYRKSVLTGSIAGRLKAIIRDVVSERKSEIIEMEIMPDHVHLPNYPQKAPGFNHGDESGNFVFQQLLDKCIPIWYS